jgi:acyl-CoA reductase-like NAD-dependent aldehyde dehydrogenase
VNNKMRIAREEIFGPVLSVIPFTDEDEAIAIANDSPYGLAAGVWTQNIRRSILMSERLRAGTVWVHTYRAVSFMSPFGGYKRSGVGRENDDGDNRDVDLGKDVRGHRPDRGNAEKQDQQGQDVESVRPPQ